MNAWFKFSRVVVILLLAASLFFLGTWVGSEMLAAWKIYAIVAMVCTALVTVSWFVGKFSSGK